MELYQILYFQILCETESYTKAAARLQVSQPTVSIAVKKLEDEVGGPLIDKTRKTFSLTPLGEAFLKHASAINSEIASTCEEMRILTNRREDSIVIEFPESMCSSLLNKLVQDYIPDHTDDKIIIRIRSLNDILNDINDQEADIAVVCADMLEPSSLMGIRPYKRMEFYAAVPFENHLSTYDVLSCNALKGQKILISEAGGMLSQSFRNIFDSYGVKPEYCKWTQDDLPVHDAYLLARQNLGIALVDQNVQGLKCIPLEPPLELDVVLYWRKVSFSPSPYSDNAHVNAKKNLIDFITSI